MKRLRKPGSHLKELYFVVLIVLWIGLLTFSLLGPRGYLEMRKAQAAVDAHKKRIEMLKMENTDRLRTVQALKTDKAALEKYAREKGYGRSGEMVLEVPRKSAVDAGSTAPEQK